MSLPTDLKFILLVSPKFEKFQRKSDYLFNVRCPICGDSQKNKSKMRGYIYRKGNDLFYRCHNCGAGMGIGNLLKHMDGSLHREYILERYKTGEINTSNNKTHMFDIPAPRFGKVDIPTYENAERCDMLPDEHFCKKYIKARQIPEWAFKKLYFTANFKKFCDEINPSHGKEELTQDARLIIPFYDEYNSLIGVSGRALVIADYKLRYIKIKANDNIKKLIYGIDRIDTTLAVKIVEGEIDSLFLTNAIASGDSSLSITADAITAKEKILIFDNEPRNKEIVKLMSNAILDGRNIVIWPNTVEGKDINEMVLNGFSCDEIESIISNNTFRGIEAQINYNYWKKL